MEYVSITKTIRGQYANLKFWFISWKKEKCDALRQKIQETIQVLKDLINNLFTVLGMCEDREDIASIAAEVMVIEQLLAS